MKKTIVRFLLGTLLCQIMLLGGVGVVVQHHGKSFIVRKTQHIAVTKGLKLELGDVLSTGLRSWVSIRMNDGTFVSVAKRSEFAIRDFVYHKPEDSKATFDCIKGFFKVISGSIGKIARDKFKVLTPSATIGIRGTEFYVDIRRKSTYVFCTKGTIVARNDLGEVIVPSGNKTVLRRGRVPEKPKRFDAQKLRKLQKTLAQEERFRGTRRSLVERSRGGVLSGNTAHGDTKKGMEIRVIPEEIKEDDLSLNDISRSQQRDIPGTPIYCPTQ